jgi:hypothetical protein
MGKPDVSKQEDKKFSTVLLDWKEVYYTNCPIVSASNIDQELGWTREEFKKIGVQYAFLHSVRENDYYPHYIHNLNNLIRFDVLFPPSTFTQTSAGSGSLGRRTYTKAAA